MAERDDLLAELDHEVEQGRVSVVDYWRRCAAIEAGRDGPVHRCGASEPGATPCQPIGERTDPTDTRRVEGMLVRPAPTYLTPPADPAPRPPRLAESPAHAPGATGLVGPQPAEHRPFAPPEGAVNLVVRRDPEPGARPARRRRRR